MRADVPIIEERVHGQSVGARGHIDTGLKLRHGVGFDLYRPAPPQSNQIVETFQLGYAAGDQADERGQIKVERVCLAEGFLDSQFHAQGATVNGYAEFVRIQHRVQVQRFHHEAHE